MFIVSVPDPNLPLHSRCLAAASTSRSLPFQAACVPRLRGHFVCAETGGISRWAKCHALMSIGLYCGLCIVCCAHLHGWTLRSRTSVDFYAILFPDLFPYKSTCAHMMVESIQNPEDCGVSTAEFVRDYYVGPMVNLTSEGDLFNQPGTILSQYRHL